MQAITHKSIRYAIAGLMMWSAVMATSHAQTYWSAATGDWYTAGNWDSGAPDAVTDAYIDNAGTAQVGTPATTASAANLYLGYHSRPDHGYLQVSDGTLDVAGVIYVGSHYNKQGSITQTGGIVQAGNLTLSNSGCFYQIDAGTLDVANLVQLGTAYTNTTFTQNGGYVNVGGNLQFSASGQAGTNTYAMAAGTLDVAGQLTTAAGSPHFSMAAGTDVNVTGGFSLGNAGSSTVDADLYGGTLDAAFLTLGDRYAVGGLLDQAGTDVTLTNGISRIRGSNATYQLRAGTLSVPSSDSVRIGGGDAYGAAPGNFLFNLNAAGATTLTENGAGDGADLILREYNTGFGTGRVGDCIGTFRGYGTVGFTGTLDNSGYIIADGDGGENTLDLSGFASVINTFNNDAVNGATDTGWYAQNGGKLALPDVAVTAGSPTVNWGEAAGDTTIDLVNSVRMAFSNVTGADSLSVSLLALDRSDIPAGIDAFGAWEFIPGASLAFDSVDLTFRFDPDALPVGGMSLDKTKICHYTGGAWQQLDTVLDLANNCATAYGVTSFSTFGVVAIPEPCTGFLVGLGLIALRRARRG